MKHLRTYSSPAILVSHITPHCGCTCTLLTAVCLWQGARRRELCGRTPGRPHPHAPSRTTRGRRQLPACAMLPSQGAWVAPAEPPASGEAQRVYGEERRKGAAQACCVLSQGGCVCSVTLQPDCMEREQCVATPATALRDMPSAHVSDV
eukprot:7387689-Prymnesium_polylepis.1